MAVALIGSPPEVMTLLVIGMLPVSVGRLTDLKKIRSSTLIVEDYRPLLLLAPPFPLRWLELLESLMTLLLAGRSLLLSDSDLVANPQHSELLNGRLIAKPLSCSVSERKVKSLHTQVEHMILTLRSFGILRQLGDVPTKHPLKLLAGYGLGYTVYWGREKVAPWNVRSEAVAPFALPLDVALPMLSILKPMKSKFQKSMISVNNVSVHVSTQDGCQKLVASLRAELMTSRCLLPPASPSDATMQCFLSNITRTELIQNDTTLEFFFSTT
uniref:Uncharacterized protein n=1 Tax=Timema tahoe TaxID=61484 RepID=A0A7R9NVD4_9NEOP|nr:unnamed protein product [Timema tahoe]